MHGQLGLEGFVSLGHKKALYVPTQVTGSLPPSKDPTEQIDMIGCGHFHALGLSSKRVVVCESRERAEKAERCI